MPSEEAQRITQPKEENLERRKTVKCVSNFFAVSAWVSIFPYTLSIQRLYQQQTTFFKH